MDSSFLITLVDPPLLLLFLLLIMLVPQANPLLLQPSNTVPLEHTLQAFLILQDPLKRGQRPPQHLRQVISLQRMLELIGVYILLIQAEGCIFVDIL